MSAARSGAAGADRVAQVSRARFSGIEGAVERRRLFQRSGKGDLAEAAPDRRLVRRLCQAPDRTAAEAVEALADVDVAVAVQLPHGEDNVLLGQIVRDRVLLQVERHAPPPS